MAEERKNSSGEGSVQGNDNEDDLTHITTSVTMVSSPEPNLEDKPAERKEEENKEKKANLSELAKDVVEKKRIRMTSNKKSSALSSSVLSDKDLDLPKTMIMGIGRGGCYILNHLLREHKHELPKGVETVAVASIIEILNGVDADCKLLIGEKILFGKTGAWTKSAIGRWAAADSLTAIENIVKNTEVLYLITTLGGGIGSGATPVIAEVAKKQGKMVFALVTTPSRTEGSEKVMNARSCLEELKKFCSRVIVYSNTVLWKKYHDSTMQKAFDAVADNIIFPIVEITHTITKDNLENIKSHMNREGFARAVYTEVKGSVYCNTLSESLSSGLWPEYEKDTARHAVVLLRCSPQVSEDTAEKIVEEFHTVMATETTVVWNYNLTTTPEDEKRMDEDSVSPMKYDITGLSGGDTEDVEHKCVKQGFLRAVVIIESDITDIFPPVSIQDTHI